MTEEEIRQKIDKVIQITIAAPLTNLTMIENPGLEKMRKTPGKPNEAGNNQRKFSRDRFLNHIGFYLLDNPHEKIADDLQEVSDRLYDAYSRLYDAEYDLRKFEVMKEKSAKENKGFKKLVVDFIIAVKEWWTAADKSQEKSKTSLVETLTKLKSDRVAARAAEQLEKGREDKKHQRRMVKTTVDSREISVSKPKKGVRVIVPGEERVKPKRRRKPRPRLTKAPPPPPPPLPGATVPPSKRGVTFLGEAGLDEHRKPSVPKPPVKPRGFKRPFKKPPPPQRGG